MCHILCRFTLDTSELLLGQNKPILNYVPCNNTALLNHPLPIPYRVVCVLTRTIVNLPATQRPTRSSSVLWVVGVPDALLIPDHRQTTVHHRHVIKSMENYYLCNVRPRLLLSIWQPPVYHIRDSGPVPCEDV